MNKHILLVMRWLNNKDSVSQEELEENRREAWATYDTACGAVDAAYWAAFPCSDNAEYWVNKYFKTTGEDRAQYEKELEK